MTTINDIERRTKLLADARAALADIVTQLNDGIEALKRDHMRALKAAVARVAERHEDLKALLEEAPDLFVRPRTVVFHGIKVGYQKGTGKLEFDDPDRVIALIRKHFPDQADALIRTRESPSKEALEELSAADLKRLGIVVEDTADRVVIKHTDSTVDKLVRALIKGATEDAEVQ